MSREIKFRAWDLDKNKYHNDICIKPNGKIIALEIYDGEMLPIRTMCIAEQYTGLKDKNGKEIYEGDILETCCGKTEVYFDDELLMYKIKARHGGTMPLVSKKSKRHFDYEIIGNIHENPELLGGKE